MKLKHLVAALSVAVSATGAFAGTTTDLGVLNASDSTFSKDFWRIFDWGSQLGAFTDYYTFSLVGPSTATGGTLVFDWGAWTSRSPRSACPAARWRRRRSTPRPTASRSRISAPATTRWR